ncbi:hypothetical protein ACRAWF_01285 [Streptomyces sp. L7]
MSDAISAVRTGRASSNRLRVGGSWCTRLAPYAGAGVPCRARGELSAGARRGR